MNQIQFLPDNETPNKILKHLNGNLKYWIIGVLISIFIGYPNWHGFLLTKKESVSIEQEKQFQEDQKELLETIILEIQKTNLLLSSLQDSLHNMGKTRQENPD